jgi:lipoprotein-releasing system permease protein
MHSFGSFERMIAFRYLRARRQEGFISLTAWFSLLGIALGVATLIIVMSVMNGFHSELMGQILGLNGHIGVMAPPGGLTDFESQIIKIQEIKHVTQVVPIIDGQVMITARSESAGAMVRGIRPSDLVKRKLVTNGVREGSLAQFEGDDAVVIGDHLAAKLGVHVGDAVTLISPKGFATAFGSMPRIGSYHIVAIFNVGMYQYDSSYIFMPLSAAQLFFRLPNQISDLQVTLDQAENPKPVMAQISKYTTPNQYIYDWQAQNAKFFDAVAVERNVMFLILTLIILVAAFNIISSLTMLVKEKNRDIAILRTMGATQSMIMRIFFLSGASIGLIGTFLGVILGLSFALNIESIRQFLQSMTGHELFAAEIYYLSKLPAQVNFSEVAVVVSVSLFLSFIFSIYPSWRAARLDPVEALRHE